VKPAGVVAVWVAANLVLAAVLPAFSESAFAIILYFAASVPALLFALAVATVKGKNPQPSRAFTLEGGSNWIPVIALGLVVVGLGWIFGSAWLALGGVTAAFGLVMLTRASWKARRTR
jgi:hypothetical protein